LNLYDAKNFGHHGRNFSFPFLSGHVITLSTILKFVPLRFMNHLRAVNKYFLIYRWRLILGVVFIIVSNYFGILAPQITGYVVDKVEHQIKVAKAISSEAPIVKSFYDPLVQQFIQTVENAGMPFSRLILFSGILLLAVALLRGFFMFLMRQTIIVMSRHIEFDQKNEVYKHYQSLDTHFYKTHSTGDLMSRMAEDVSRVRMYTGPAIMYLVNLSALISFSLFYMFRKNAELTLYVLSPLPILAIAIYFVNNIINKKSEQIQEQLSDLTTNAQESYSGIRVIKSFVQEKSMLRFFSLNADKYRNSAVNLAKVEAVYFPSIGLLIGLSTLLTILIGGIYQVNNQVSSGTIAEFVVYINMLSFPVSAIGWVASMIQRASASQKRLNEFLETQPTIADRPGAVDLSDIREIQFKNLGFVYPHTGIQAISSFNLQIKRGEKVAIIGRTGSGKSTIAQLLLRMYDPGNGEILINGTDLRNIRLASLRKHISFVPQDVFLFSDTVKNNIRFGADEASDEEVLTAARQAAVDGEINGFSEGYETMIGERGVNLSGGQKQRLSIARALCKQSGLLLFDDCLSAVDAKTEKQILSGLYEVMKDRTAIIITHRIFSLFEFDKIIVLEDGTITEQGRHAELMALNGYYCELYHKQQDTEDQSKPAMAK
jgi:ATP-binding cassette subfamily B protein